MRFLDKVSVGSLGMVIRFPFGMILRWEIDPSVRQFKVLFLFLRTASVLLMLLKGWGFGTFQKFILPYQITSVIL